MWWCRGVLNNNINELTQNNPITIAALDPSWTQTGMGPLRARSPSVPIAKQDLSQGAATGARSYPPSTPFDKAPMTAAALMSAFFVRFA